MPLLFWGMFDFVRAETRKRNTLKLMEPLRNAWNRLGHVEAGVVEGVEGHRRTLMLPSILSPYPSAANMLPKPTAANLRKFAETPVVRRAINVIKDRIASLDWQVKVRRGYCYAAIEDAAGRMAAIRLAFEEPNEADSFRTLAEQVLEDALVGGFGAIEVNLT